MISIHKYIQHSVLARGIALMLCAALLLAHVYPIARIYAEDKEEQTTQEIITPIPNPIDIVVENDTTTVDIELENTAITGENIIGDIVDTPTPTPLNEPSSITQTPTPLVADLSVTPTPETTESSTESAILVENTAAVESTVSAIAQTGNNTVTSPTQIEQQNETNTSNVTPTPNINTTTSISTGDAYAYANLENSVNTTNINSEIIYHTINIYMDEINNIDLSLPADLAKQLVNENPNLLTMNATLSQLNIDNEASVNNTITISSNTGRNSSSESTTATIHTGDAFTILSLLNRINFIMIDSVIHIAIINIFSNFTGNILLPDVSEQTTSCSDCGSITVKNDADISTNVSLIADTGNNTITAAGGDIQSGDAYTAISLNTIANTVLYSSEHLALTINNFGYWDGNFLGWATDGLTTSTDPVIPSKPCNTCTGNIDINNNTILHNTITLSATTGNNTIDTSENGTIDTGNAYTTANIINLVNTSLIRSFGLFGFINIFGSWKGDIGSKSLFPPAQYEQVQNETIAIITDESKNQNPQTQSAMRESGGLLTVTNNNNVGAYVLPGDTVTLFLNTKNEGSGMVYDTKLIVMLIKDGVEAGTSLFTLGNIAAGKMVKVTTGLVLSKEIPPGTYTIRAASYGYTGNENIKIQSYADSFFEIQDNAFPILQTTKKNISEPIFETQVLGVERQVTEEPNILYSLVILLLLIPAYAIFQFSQNRFHLHFLLESDFAPLARLNALRTFLL